MMQNIIRNSTLFISLSSLSLFVLSVSFFVPVVGYAAPTPATTAGDTGITYECVNGDCTYNDLVNAVQKVIKIAIEYALFFSVVIIAYAGFIYMTSEGNPGKLKKAHEMFQKVAIGIVLIMAAWLIVNLIVSTLVSDNIKDSASFPLKK